MALKVLEEKDGTMFPDELSAIAALRTALEQPQQVSFEDNNGAERERPEDCQRFGANGKPAAVWVNNVRYVPEAAREQQPEPVAFLFGSLPVYDAATSPAVPEGYALIGIDALKAWGKYDEVRDACRHPLAATSPRSEWRGLTLDDKRRLDESLNLQKRFPVIDAIEAALKEKNAA